MFRMLGNTVQLIYYIVRWSEGGIEMQEECVSEEHKNEVEQKLTEQGIEFTTETIDQTGNEWINGLNFESKNEAEKVLAAGEENWTPPKSVEELTEENEVLKEQVNTTQEAIDFLLINNI